MGSKKNKKESKPKQRDKSKVDERLKQVASFETDEGDKFKMENDEKVDKYMKFGRPRKIKKFVEMTIRDQNKFGRRTHRKTAPMPWNRKKSSL